MCEKMVAIATDQAGHRHLRRKRFAGNKPLLPISFTSKNIILLVHIVVLVVVVVLVSNDDHHHLHSKCHFVYTTHITACPCNTAVLIPLISPSPSSSLQRHSNPFFPTWAVLVVASSPLNVRCDRHMSPFSILLLPIIHATPLPLPLIIIIR